MPDTGNRIGSDQRAWRREQPKTGGLMLRLLTHPISTMPHGMGWYLLPGGLAVIDCYGSIIRNKFAHCLNIQAEVGGAFQA
jgi:hypothetical protein